MTVFRGDCFDLAPMWLESGSIDLIVTDPPYGGIVDEEWDREWSLADQWKMTQVISDLLAPGGTAYVWGGVGTYQNRLFFEWLSHVESMVDLRIWDVITWKKKRGYGVANRYLFTREECVMLVKGDKPKTFNKPYLAKERGYAGYNAKYPALSKYLRRSNVWDDVSEIFRGKIHPAAKPIDLARIQVATSSNNGDHIVDLFAGSGGVGVACEELGRRYTLFEKSECPMYPGLL